MRVLTIEYATKFVILKDYGVPSEVIAWVPLTIRKTPASHRCNIVFGLGRMLGFLYGFKAEASNFG